MAAPGISITSKLGRCVSKNSLLFVCDIQTRFESFIRHFDGIVETSGRLIQAAQILKMPIVVTEQYPKALGSTVPQLKKYLGDIPCHPKNNFSMCCQPVVDTLRQHPERNFVILCGLETQACIQQSAIDLRSGGYEVMVVADAVSSRNEADRIVAFSFLKQIGCFVSTTESVIQSLVQGKDHPDFKEVAKLIKDSSPDTGLVNALGGKL